MIGRLARRLGFQQSVPVALLEGWSIPATTELPVELAPREGAAACQVDEYGRLQVVGASWTLDFTIAAGVQWVAAANTQRTNQHLDAPGVLVTTYTTPAGEVEQRVAAGVVDGQPAAIVEIENKGGVAIAVGAVARPLRHDGRGYIGEVAVDSDTLSVDGQMAARFASKPTTVAAFDGASGDLIENMPEADQAVPAATMKCRSGGAQAAAIWPLPHTATLRLVVALREPIGTSAAVPTTHDINRGWHSHLKRGMRLEVDGMSAGDDLVVAARSLLTLWPANDNSPQAILAMSELGFGRDAARLFPQLERNEDDPSVIRALSRWAQLGEQGHQLDDLERILGRLAQAAHGIAAQGGNLAGPAWLESALITLGGRLHQIDQPDVGDRIQGFTATLRHDADTDDQLARLSKGLDDRGLWNAGQVRSAAELVTAVRSIAVDDAGGELRVLAALPAMWRGRTIDAFALPVANGTLSYGIRWHGPRPALLWEANLAPEAPFQISAPGIDPAFHSTERAGETLLADPGWQVS